MVSEESALAALSPRALAPSQQQNITLAASTGQYSDAVIRVGDQYQVSSKRTQAMRSQGKMLWALTAWFCCCGFYCRALDPRGSGVKGDSDS